MSSEFSRKAGCFLALLGAWCLLLPGCSKETATKTAGHKASKGGSGSRNSSAERLRWNLQTLTGVYLENGHHDPAWDEFATNALNLFAQFRSGAQAIEDDELARNCRQALARGCADPMILYLHTKFVVATQQDATSGDVADGYRKAAAAAGKTPCPHIQKFYIYLRGSEALNAGRGGKADLPQIHSLRRGAAQALLLALEDESMPVGEAYDATRDLLFALNNNATEAAEFYRRIGPALLERWPAEPLILLLQGTVQIEEAWRARGSGVADAVTPEGWEKFRSLLAQAATTLEKAWQLDSTNPRIASEMLRVELGEAKGRERFDLWFERAMNLNTNYYEACYRKLYYLEPKWHGSAKEMLAFGRTCVDSPQWGGDVPLILVEAHTSLAGYAQQSGNTNYYKNPNVWADIQLAYEKFFTMNPKAVQARQNYAWYAYACEKWDEFNKQLPLLGHTNYAFFGGQESFARMVTLAQEKGAPHKN